MKPIAGIDINDLILAGRSCAFRICDRDQCAQIFQDALEEKWQPDNCVDTLVTLLCDALENKQREIDALHRILDSVRSEEFAI